MSSAKQHFLDLFFNPKSVAVVGATRNVNTPNFSLVANLVKLKYPGKVYPVNPNAKEVMGLRAYPDVQSIEGEIDLAVLSVPALSTLGVVKDCVAKGVKGITITAGGFSEIGTEGKKMQGEIRSLLRESGIRTIGPNALSPINSANKFIIGFGPADKLPRGRVSLIFQSGFYQPRFNWLVSDFHLSFNKLIDLGNKMDINEVDALEYFAQDESTKAIAMHLESIAGDGRRFLQLLKDITREKPVIVLKSGRTEAGAKAASSHTGAIIKSSDAIFDTALKQAEPLERVTPEKDDPDDEQVEQQRGAASGDPAADPLSDDELEAGQWFREQREDGAAVFFVRELAGCHVDGQEPAEEPCHQEPDVLDIPRHAFQAEDVEGR